MTAKRHKGLRAEKLGFHVDEPTKALTERIAPLERRTLSTANLHHMAWRRRLRQVVKVEIRDPVTPQMRNAAENPLRFACGRFPPCFPRSRTGGGEAEDDPEGPF